MHLLSSKSHKESKGLYRKPFPLFDDLEEVFAKDRATGVKDDQVMNVQDITQDDATSSKKSIEVSSTNHDDVLTEGSSKRTIDEGSSKKPTMKNLRITNKEIQNFQKNLESMMGNMLENSNAQIDKLVSILEGPKNIKVGLREEL